MEILDRIVAWARADPNVLALVLTGSRARGAADAFSDFDVEVIAKDVEPLVREHEWWRRLGAVWTYWHDARRPRRSASTTPSEPRPRSRTTSVRSRARRVGRYR